MSRTFRTRLPEQVAGQLVELCDLTQRPISAVIRQTVRYVIDHPQLWPELFAAETSTVIDDRTPQQKANWERDAAALTTLDSRLVALYKTPLRI